MFGRVRYEDVSRCNECSENIPLILSLIAGLDRMRYECGSCGTELELDGKRQFTPQAEE
jgi:hypothetical protein